MAGVGLLLGSLLILGGALFVLLWLGKRLRDGALEGPRVIDSFVKEGWFKEEDYLKIVALCDVTCDSIYYPWWYLWWFYRDEKSF